MSRKTRQSLKPRQSGLPEAFGSLSLDGRQSLGRQSIGRQSTGRQSIYGRQSMTVKTIPKDPRPIRDKQWVSQGIKSLIASLVQLGYPNTLSPKQLQTPSQKEFFGIFKFLYSCLDPSHKFGERLEEELPFLLKSLKYPFAESINKSHLMSVASLQTWPVLLASLLWLVDLIMVFALIMVL
ncbi:kinetochore protein NDC80 [Gorgonomyces haynaldii]|nr:kinetochore protein NDC80 [Gorgonomyces haynaldii]